MTGDEALFLRKKGTTCLPLYEANMIHIYDHRFGFFDEKSLDQRTSLESKMNPGYEPSPRYWVTPFSLCAKIYPFLRHPIELCMTNAPSACFELSRALMHLNPNAVTIARDVKSKWFAAPDLLKEQGEHPLCNVKLEESLPAILGSNDCSIACELLVSLLLPKYLIGWRDITNDANQRTLLCSFMPTSGSGHTINNLSCNLGPIYEACLVAQLSSIVCDYVVRCKLGGTHLTHSYMEQVPVISPKSFDEKARRFIAVRVAELVYTSSAMAQFYEELIAELKDDTVKRDAPFEFNENRRHKIKCELDAFIAHLFGLSREDLVFILDPSELLGADYPSHTFLGLKSKEVRDFGEYRTRRRVIQAWDEIVEPLRRVQA
jgi:hypothetical protein